MLGKQIVLRLSPESSCETIWDQIPNRSREELIELYARVIARAAKVSVSTPRKELRDENVDE